jgi:Flp pilus assembly protein TadB
MDEGALSLLQLLILKLQSGQSLLPALDELVQNSLSGSLAHDVNTFIVGPVSGGANITQVLSQLRGSPRYKDTWRLRSIFRHLATATRAQMPAHKIAARLQTLQQALVDTYALQLELQADLAQAKYSRWIVSATLPVTTFALNGFAPDIAANLFHTIPGQIILIFVVIMVIMLNVVGGLIAKMPPLEL